MKDHGTPPRSARKRAAFCVAAVLILLGTLELFGRLAGLPQGSITHLRKLAAMTPAEFESTLGMFPPGYRGRIEWPKVLAFDVSINSAGFRGPEIAAPDDGRPRILCLGDSTTFGLYVDDADAYPATLRAAVPTHTVINAGHPAWGLHDELRYFRERGHKVEPDLVLHVVCINDFTDIDGDLDATKSNYARKCDRIQAGMTYGEWIRQRTALGEAFTLAGIAIRHLQKGDDTVEVGPIQPISDTAWSEFTILYEQLVATCTAANAKLVTACLPCIEVEPGASRRLFEAQVQELATKFAVPFIEVDAAFRDAERSGAQLFLLPHDTHANPAGNTLLAKTLAQGLGELGLIED